MMPLAQMEGVHAACVGYAAAFLDQTAFYRIWPNVAGFQMPTSSWNPWENSLGFESVFWVEAHNEWLFLICRDEVTFSVT